MNQPTGTRRHTRRTLLTAALGTTAALGLSAGAAHAAPFGTTLNSTQLTALAAR